jgi:hypothetical protein
MMIALLVAVEIVVAGLVLYSLGGMHGAFAGGLHRVDFSPATIAPLAAGATPRITVDDPDDRVVVTTSPDAMVHVTDRTEAHGMYWGTSSFPKLDVQRTADGVSVSRPGQSVNGIHFALFGIDTERIEVAVPAGSTVALEQCSGADVTGISGSTTVRSQDGHIVLADLRGAVDAQSSDGYIEVRNVHTDRVALHTDNGHIELHDVAAAIFEATTNDGRITIDSLRVAGDGSRAKIHSDNGSVLLSADFAPGGTYDISTDDGRITATLPSQANLVVAASTNDGRVVRDGQSFDDDGATHRTFTLGSGAGHLNLSSDNGTISITTNGAI